MSRKKTHEEYVAEVAAINPNIEVIGAYINSSSKITHKCLIDGFEWKSAPATILQGHGCPMCHGGIKQTHEQYVEKLSTKNPSIIVLGQYVNSSTKIMHKCLIDGHEWLVTPNNILNGKGCPLCSGTMRKTHEQYIEELKIKNSSIVAVGQYINNATKITHRCLIHNYEWEISPQHVLAGYGCPMCRDDKLRNKFRRSHDEYIDEVSIINKDIVVIGEYVNARTHIRHKCLVCGWEWDTIPENILRGHGCPQCNKCSKSIGEKKIAAWLDSNDITYKTQKTFDNCRDRQVLQFDFYLPDYNIAIEYNGKQHYEPVDYFGGKKSFELQQKHDKIKENYCKENNIRLFIIPYFEDINIKLKELGDLIIAKEVAA